MSVKLALVKLVSWIDNALTGVPWHQRRYASNAYLENAERLGIKNADSLLQFIRQDWEARRALERIEP